MRQHISLLLTTMPGSYRYSRLYGSLMNKHHFLLPDKTRGEKRLEQELKLKLQENLKFLINKYEPRLVVEDIEVGVNPEKENNDSPASKDGRITFQVAITGTINGRDTFTHTELFFLK